MQPIDQYILARTAELTGKITKAYADFEFHRVYHLLNEFCNSELSAFYLDVLKDRLYTYPVKFKPGREYQRELYIARRSAQTAIYKITDALARLTAPILSFTADEVYQSLPGTQSSVHLTLFPKPEDLAPTAQAGQLIVDWDQLFQVRNEVLTKLEGLRAQKVIGKSLEATVTFSAREYIAVPALTKHAEALPELFNVSEVGFLPENDTDPNALTPLTVDRSTHIKCDRCWRFTDDVGNDANYPTVCLRCAEALDAIDFSPYAAATN
jgi:isoleucyl-tRNA synthetase